MEGGPDLSPPAKISFAKIFALYVFEVAGCRRGGSETETLAVTRGLVSFHTMTAQKASPLKVRY